MRWLRASVPTVVVIAILLAGFGLSRVFVWLDGLNEPLRTVTPENGSTLSDGTNVIGHTVCDSGCGGWTVVHGVYSGSIRANVR